MKVTPGIDDLEAALGPDTHPETRALVHLYQEGLYTYGELITVLIKLAFQLPPPAIVQGLPSIVIEHLKAQVQHIPEGPEQVFFMKYPTFRRDIDEKEAVERFNREWYSALLRMHQHFS